MTKTNQAAGDDDSTYEAPTISRLGTLAELTLGGALPIGDGVGGDGGSV